MTDILSAPCDLYPLGNESLVPVGVDAERYYQRFLENSQRLFASQADKLDIFRVLSGSGGEIDVQPTKCITYGD
jgi:hypothetical protein